jgi:hypothetical protein
MRPSPRLSSSVLSSGLSASLVLVGCTLLGASVPGWVASAHAQTTVSVLGLTSLEGDDEFARNFTGALRHAASQVEGWTVSDRDVALSQMELTHDCSSSDAGCMTQIAVTLGSARVIYGTIQRAAIGTRYEFQVTLFLFDADSGRVDERVTDNISSSDTDIDALRDPARTMVRALSASMSPGTIRVTGTPNLEVQIDGTVVGRTDSGGNYVSDPVPPGSHTVRLGDAESSVTIAGDEALAAFAMVEGGGEGGGSVLPYVGIGLMVVGAAALAVSFWSMGEISSSSNSPAFTEYRRQIGRLDGVTLETNICQVQYTNMSTVGADACANGATMELLQYVFLATGVVALGAGTALLVVGLGEGSGTADTASTSGLRLRFSPSFGTEHAYLGATLEF